jgi:hypothetical protein
MNMLKHFVTGLVWCMLFGILTANAFAETDSAYWNEESIEGGITDKLSATIEAKYRFNDDASKHYYSSTALELNYELLAWLEAGAGYREIYKLKKTAWQQEKRQYLQAEVKLKADGWKLKNRLRVELRDAPSEKTYYRYRDKITIKTPWTWTPAEINPYVADEVFVEEKEGEGFNENRTYAGIDMKLTERVGFELYYMYNIERKDHAWNDRTRVFGTDVKVHF